MQANKIAPLAAALLFLGSSLAVAASTDSVPTVPLPTRQTFLGDLADLAAPELRGDLATLEPLLSSNELPATSGLLAKVDALHGAYADADSARAALAATADLAGLPLSGAAAPAPASATAEIVALYVFAGEAFTLADVAELDARVSRLTAEQQDGVATLVAAVNQVLVAQRNGGSAYDAAAGVLDAADAVEGLFAPQPTASAAACDVFEDPLQLIWIGSPCDDTVSAQPARMLSYDPGGNDAYFHNAGGAGGVPTLGEELVLLGIESERGIGSLTENLTLGGIFPLDPGNTTWEDWVINTFPQPVLDTLTNVTGSIVPSVGGVLDFIAGIHPIVEVHPEVARQSVPVAVHIDEAGSDTYQSTTMWAQAGAIGNAVGILLERDGSDTYDCQRNCQGYAQRGLGLLIDEAGSDSYDALDGAQGTGDGGLLFDLAGDDTYSGRSSVQGSTASAALPRAVPGLLLDRSGSDQYTATGNIAQGAGAFLVDLSGDDAYTQQGHTQGQAQGVGLSGGVGILLDASGSDTYSAMTEAQGAGVTGQGVLADLRGDDSYTSAGTGQGTGRGAGFGLLYDESGNDAYSAVTGAQGAGTMFGAGALVDLAGDDAYTATGSAQGTSSSSPGGPLGLLLDASGSDTYVAGAGSQGSGQSGLGAGVLADLKGLDSYTAGAFSQGSGGELGGVGILLDGTPERTETPGVSITVQVNPEEPSYDHYLAGNFSQGSSGPVGGVGLLMDREHNGGQRNTFVAGEYSQGAATALGIGVLLSNTGKDDYTAGAFSQGASDGGLGVLVDQTGNDRYYPADASNSHGYGESHFDTVPPTVGVGLLVDGAGNDQHPDMGDNECKHKGDIGLAVDANGLALGDGCLAVVLGAVADAVGQAIPELQAQVLNIINGILFPAPGTPPSGTVYFYDGMEDAAASGSLWTVSNASDLACVGLGDPEPLSGWRIRNQTSDPQVAPNAHSGAHYWYAGALHGASYTACTVAELTTATISLATAVNPELTYWYAGSSETGFDFLTVEVLDLTASTTTEVAQYSGDAVNMVDPNLALPVYAQEAFDLTPFAGHDIQVRFTFTSDANLEIGQGWNIDDVLVNE